MQEFPIQEAGMARTKSNIISKIVHAEMLRLRCLRQDSEFRADLKRLEQTAKRLPPLPLIPVRELSPTNWRLPARTQKKLQKWREAAQTFLGKWGFSPKLSENGAVELFVRSPVSFEISSSKRAAKWHLDETFLSAGDVQTLHRYYATFLKRHGDIVERRVNLKARERKAVAHELQAEGKNIRKIAKTLYQKEYKKAVSKTIDLKKLPDGELRDKFRRLVVQFAEHGMRWDAAEKRAAKEMGLDIRSEATKVKPLTERTRHLLKTRQK